MQKLIIYFFTLSILWPTVLVSESEPEKSVVKIINSSLVPSWSAPWKFENVRKSSGSGFVIKGKKIMSNAHVISWSRQILVMKYQDPRPYLAHVVYVAHDADLAILDVEDPSFYDGLEPLEIGPLPKVRSAVVTYGYPAGGEQISFTRGVVSRIEVQPYSHIGNRALLAVQTDAAINPGNSGGPVIQDGKVVGVAFQGMPGLENTGFFIPPPIIQHVLKDIEDGVYDGFPQIEIRITPLQNSAYRKYLGLNNQSIGARIDFIDPFSPSNDILKQDDVLLKIGEYTVTSDGTILFDGNMVHASVALSLAQANEELTLKILRNKQEMDLKIKMHVIKYDSAEGFKYTLPKYFIHGGLVFTPLCRDFVQSLREGTDKDNFNMDLFYTLFFSRQENPQAWRSEPVVLASILAHPVNANFQVKSKALVDRVNGRRISNLKELVDAINSNTNKYDVIEFMPDGAIECIDHEKAVAVTGEILSTYQISEQSRL